MKIKNIKNYIDYLLQWIKQQVVSARKTGVVIGISGGIDSACCLALCKQIKEIKIYPYYFYIQQNQDELKYIHDLEKTFKIKITKINLSKSFQAIQCELSIANQLSLRNLKIRLHSICLYGIAQNENSLVLGTSNADEIYIGYFTKFGDINSDLSPLASINKKQIYEISKILNVPLSIIKRAPTAGLYKGQTDEKELKLKYDEIDNYLAGIKINKKSKNKIQHLHSQTSHKRIFINKPLSYENWCLKK